MRRYKSKAYYELQHEEPNNWAIAIDGKIWKVFAHWKHSHTWCQNLCDRKTAETGKKWTVTPWAGQPTA